MQAPAMFNCQASDAGLLHAQNRKLPNIPSQANVEPKATNSIYPKTLLVLFNTIKYDFDIPIPDILPLAPALCLPSYLAF